MDFNKVTKTLTAGIAMMAALALAGCLSDSESAADAQNQSPNPPPVSNGAPTISGSPPTAASVGVAYPFTPSASDPDGDTLTFSVANLPGWANFDTTTGRISGMPTLGDIGTFAGIRISVSDGNFTSSLSAFSVEVMQDNAALGSATLSWTAPATNTDGSQFSDLIAFRIYYGTAPGQWSNQIYLDNPSITTYVVQNLMPDTYYFTATTINSAGLESAFSNIASKTIQ